MTGTTDGWVTITLPELEVPQGPVEDGMLRLEVVLDGRGVGWVTEITVELESSELAHVEQLEHALA